MRGEGPKGRGRSRDSGRADGGGVQLAVRIDAADPRVLHFPFPGNPYDSDYTSVPFCMNPVTSSMLVVTPLVAAAQARPAATGGPITSKDG